MKQIPSNNPTRPTRDLNLLLAALGLLVSFCLAAKLGPQVEQRLIENGAGDDDPVARWLGDSRRMMAASMFVKADAYFHSGYYPTIYDNNAPFKTAHMAEDSGAAKSKNTGDENEIFTHPHNWVERFNLNFFPSTHTHLDQGGATGDLGDSSQVKEIMPWLKLSAELDQQNIQTYLVTAYWLRVRMHKIAEAESFLRDGLQANRGSAAILYELGQLYREGRNQPAQARNLYLAALESWDKENQGREEQDEFLIGHIAAALFELEKHEGNTAKAIEYLKLLKRVSPDPKAIQKQIDELDLTSSLFPDVLGNASRNLNPNKSNQP